MDKLKMQSENLVDENVEKIGKLFPNCITEGRDENGQTTKFVDFDMLKQELSKVVVDGNDERYMLNWAGKKQSILTANSPINATLRPCEEESVGKDGKAGGFDSENLYIEGDNLDVLKLLRETYLNKIKMIYIDPPYNTGNDFVYNDDFATSADEYLQNSKSYDEEGNRMVQNLNSNGRFHSDWLSMMYPRLKLARDLLTDDGVIFISIDDNEVDNLKKICDETFGQYNRIGLISVINNLKGRSDDNFFATCNEFLLVYAKNKDKLIFGGFKLDDEELENGYDKQDEIGFYKLIGFRKTGIGWERHNRPYMFYPVLYKDKKFSSVTDDEFEKIYNISDNSFNDNYISQLTYFYKEKGYDVIWPLNENGEYGRWRWGRETFFQQKDFNLEINNAGTLCTKMRATLEDGSIRVKTAKTVWYKPEYDTGSGAKVLKNLFTNTSDIFSNPKSVIYIKDMLKITTKNNDIILDFFSGSATTAHAIMELNAEDGGNRKFIMVQLPEKTDEKSEAYKAGYKNICEIGKERIRRAGKKIRDDIMSGKILFQEKGKHDPKSEEFKKAMEIAVDNLENNRLDSIYLEEKKLPDIGFRVLKLDSSNMKDVYYFPSDTEQTNLLDLVSNIKEDRSSLDLLFQVMLDMGVMLSQKIEKRSIQGKTVYIVGEYDEENQPNLICCFDDNISEDVVTEIAKLKPIYAVFRDSSMSTDSMSVNFDQIFATHSPNTTRKVL